MAYVKTNWVARVGENLDKFTKYDETANTVVLVNTPDAVTTPGTEISPGNMEHIEQGIFEAHELIADETQQREADVQNLQEEDQSLLSALGEEVQAREDLQVALGEEVQSRQDADEALQEQINAFQDISDALEGGSFTELFTSKQDKITSTGSGNLLTAPTAPGGQPGTKAVAELATAAEVALKANRDSPEFTGIPRVPNKTTAAANDGTRIATEAQVALKANRDSPEFAGIPTVPSKTTAASSSYPTRIATEAQVALKANNASPALTGTPTAPDISSIPLTKQAGAECLNNWGSQIVTMNTLRNAIIKNNFPVGVYYTQYPVMGKGSLSGSDNMFPASESPAQLFGGTWTEMYVGREVFFKTAPTTIEANRGKVYNASTQQWSGAGRTGVQEDAIRNIEASWTRSAEAGYGWTSGAGTTVYTNEWMPEVVGARRGNNTQLSFNAGRVVPVDTTNHPTNMLIKVWQKTNA